MGDLELKTCDKQLSDGDKYCTAKITKKLEKGSYVIAFWTKGEEGFFLQFVLDRPFQLQEQDAAKFWKIAGFGQNFLDDQYSTEFLSLSKKNNQRNSSST